MASTPALQVQVHEAVGLQPRQAGTAFADLLSAMEALREAFLAGKSWVFTKELHVILVSVNSSPVVLGYLNLSSERSLIVDIFRFRFQVHPCEQLLNLLAGECAICQIIYSLAGLF